MENSAMLVLKEVQEAFKGEAEKLGLKNEQDVVNIIKGVRKEMREERHENND